MSKAIFKSLRSFLQDEDGPTAVEYAVMLALILMVCIGAIGTFGDSTGGSFARTNQRLSEVMGNSS